MSDSLGNAASNQKAKTAWMVAVNRASILPKSVWMHDALDMQSMVCILVPQVSRAACAWSPIPARLRTLAFGRSWFDRFTCCKSKCILPASEFIVWSRSSVMRQALERLVLHWLDHVRDRLSAESWLQILQALVDFDLPRVFHTAIQMALVSRYAQQDVFRALVFSVF